MKYLIGDNLSFGYSRDFVLENVSVTVKSSQITALLGPSGSGKTTLVWLLAGLLKPDAGRVLLADNSDPTDPAARPFDHESPRIGMTFQQSALWEHLTVEQHLQLVLAGQKLPRPQRQRRINRMLSRLEIESLQKSRPAQLSGGQRQRVSIARALVVEPQWVFLDEPLAHLDKSNRQSFFDLLREILTETDAGVLLATHHADDAMNLANDVINL